MSLLELQQTYTAERRRYDADTGQLRAVAGQYKAAKDALSTVQEHEKLCTETSVFLNSFAEEAQQQIQAKIETLVTHALGTIFGDDMKFRMVTSVKSNRSQLDFEIVSMMEGVEVVTPVMGSRGGGVAAVVGFLLRLVVLLLTPNRERLLVLDETFAQVSEEYEGRLAEFLRELVDKAGVQIIMVTHSAAYSDAADKVYRFTLRDGKTVVS